MANVNKATLKGYFQAGDTPTESNYVDLIDSQLNLAEGGTQIMSGTLSASYAEIGYVAQQKLHLGGSGIGTGSIGSTFVIGKTFEVVGDINVSSGNISGSNNLIINQITASNIGFISASATGHITSSANIKAVSGSLTYLNVSTGNVVAKGIILGSDGLNFGKTAKGSIGTYGATIDAGSGRSITFILTGIPTIPGKADQKIAKSAVTFIKNSSVTPTDAVIINCTTHNLSATAFGQGSGTGSGFFLSLGNEDNAAFTAGSATFTATIL